MVGVWGGVRGVTPHVGTANAPNQMVNFSLCAPRASHAREHRCVYVLLAHVEG